jgi:hypothetical protein
VTLALMGALGNGCLVTDRRTFRDEPDWPPQILRSPGEPMEGTIVWLDNMQSQPWTLRVVFSEHNVFQ